jgi:hypothetical protein
MKCPAGLAGDLSLRLKIGSAGDDVGGEYYAQASVYEPSPSSGCGL